jgi:hypothetical protein
MGCKPGKVDTGPHGGELGWRKKGETGGLRLKKEKGPGELASGLCTREKCQAGARLHGRRKEEKKKWAILWRKRV